MPQHITVVDYDPRWPLLYAKERGAIASVLKENCLALWHIGSTAVPGLAARPVIDMLAAVRSPEDVDGLAGQFALLGYEYLGESGLAGRRYLRKGGDERTHQLHIFKSTDLHSLQRHLAVRDYLRAHAGERAAYAALKRQLAQRFPYSIDNYCEGKDDFVRKLELKALSAYDGDWDQLYLAAREVQIPRRLTALTEAGSVAAALLTNQGHIYRGVCIDTACSLGMCAERNAIADMLTYGESRIRKIVAVMPGGKPGMPCGACRELMLQLDAASPDIEILCDYDSKSSVRLRELLPEWWYEGQRTA